MLLRQLLTLTVQLVFFLFFAIYSTSLAYSPTCPEPFHSCPTKDGIICQKFSCGSSPTTTSNNGCPKGWYRCTDKAYKDGVCKREPCNNNSGGRRK